MDPDRICYVYKLTEISTGKWYIGSRTKKGCSPNDGYMGSSKIVTKNVRSNPTNWNKEILYIGNIKEIIELEVKILCEVDAKNNPMSYNKHNGDGKFTNSGKTHSQETKEKISKSNKGKPRHKSADDERRRIEQVKLAIAGKPQSIEHRKKRSIAMSGKPQSEEHKKKRSEALKEFHRNKNKINNTNGVYR